MCTAGFDGCVRFRDHAGHCHGFKWQRGGILEYHLQRNFDTFRSTCFIRALHDNMPVAAVWDKQADRVEIRRYQELLEQYRKQADIRHDLKNHLISLSALAGHEEWDKLKEYLLKLCNAGMIGEEDIETGNSVVDAIVNTKKQAARQKNIKFDCSVTISKPLIIDEYDLCIIWGNILDNAIKAAEVSEERNILVQAGIVKRNLIINVKNTMVPDGRQKAFGMDDWGTGLTNVNKIVQKENGIMDIEIKGAVFDISIMLPVAVYDMK